MKKIVPVAVAAAVVMAVGTMLVSVISYEQSRETEYFLVG